MFLASLFGKGAAAPIEALGNTFDKLFTSDEEKAQGQAVLARIAMQPSILQAEIDKMEAGHRSLFVAGWRPFIGWVCGVGLAWSFIGAPMFAWTAALAGSTVPPPDIPTDVMGDLVLALLGLGSLRTFEKFQGKAK